MTRKVAITVGLTVLLIAAGCAQLEADQALMFRQFNADVQAGLADCKVAPNACEPTLELLAGELDKWAQLIADPSL